MVRNCKSCVRHLHNEPICILPDGSQSEAIEFVKELDCMHYFSIVDSLKVLCDERSDFALIGLSKLMVKQIINLLED